MSATTDRPLVDAAPKACALCPWRLENQGQRHPHGFYSKRNLERLWAGLRSARAPGMTCHPTDPRMATFEGYERTADAKLVRECAGSIILVVREVMRFQAIVNDDPDRTDALREYRRQQPRGLTRAGLAEVVSRFLFGGSPLARAIKASSTMVNDPEVGYPVLGEWDPAILNRAMPER